MKRGMEKERKQKKKKIYATSNKEECGSQYFKVPEVIV
jgi:hypothetical protein